MTVPNESLTAEAVMNRLLSEAERVGDPRRLGTLSRLVEACDELLSGEAYRRAKGAQRDPEFFNPNFLRLNSNTIHQYVRLRAYLDGAETTWTGPVATTIRGENDLTTYVRLREAEAKRPGKVRAKRPRARKLEEIVGSIQSITDQAVLRQALVDGRKYKRELDIVLATLRRLPDFDVDALKEGKILTSRPYDVGESIIAPEDAKTLRKLLVRFRDNTELAEFGLVYRSGRLKMDMPPGTDLVLPEEMSLLARLAGVGLDHASI